MSVSPEMALVPIFTENIERKGNFPQTIATITCLPASVVIHSPFPSVTVERKCPCPIKGQPLHVCAEFCFLSYCSRTCFNSVLSHISNGPFHVCFSFCCQSKAGRLVFSAAELATFSLIFLQKFL